MEEDDNNIKIKIKSIDNEEFELAVKGHTNAEEIKSIIAEKKNVEKQDIRLIYQGQCLVNEKTIADYNIQNDHIIHLVVRKKENPSTTANEENGNIGTGANNPNNPTYGKNDSINMNTLRSNDGSVVGGDPLHINFSSNMNSSSSMNNPNANINTTTTTSSSTNIPSINANPNVASSTPLYFTHMRLTRNDNMDGDLMGQTNICSLLNDIMSQVNINPNFVYGAATAAANAAAANAAGLGGAGLGGAGLGGAGLGGAGLGGAGLGGVGLGLGGVAGIGSSMGSVIGQPNMGTENGETIFTASVRTNGINSNVNDFVTSNCNVDSKDQKNEAFDGKGNVETGKDARNAHVDKKWEKNKKHMTEKKKHDGNDEPNGQGADRRHARNGISGANGGEESDDGSSGSGSESSSGKSDGNCNKSNKSYEDDTKEEQKKMKKIKKKRKSLSKEMKVSNKYKKGKDGKHSSDTSSKSDSSTSSHSGTSLLYVDKAMKGDEKKKKAIKLSKYNKKKKRKNKHKKKKSYDSSSFTSGSSFGDDDDDDDELGKNEKKYRKKEKEKKRKKKKKFLFDPNFLYHQNYMYHPTDTVNHARLNKHFNQYFGGGKESMLPHAYHHPLFALHHRSRASGCGNFLRETKNSLNYGRDDISEIHENLNSVNNNIMEDFTKQKEKRKKAHSSSKALFANGGLHDSNLLDLSGSNIQGNRTGNKKKKKKAVCRGGCSELNFSLLLLLFRLFLFRLFLFRLFLFRLFLFRLFLFRLFLFRLFLFRLFLFRLFLFRLFLFRLFLFRLFHFASSYFSLFFYAYPYDTSTPFVDAGGMMDEQNYPNPKGEYENIIPLSDVERNNEIVQNDCLRTNGRVMVNEGEGAILSDNNSLSGNMRSIQMSSDRRNSALRRSDQKCLNDGNDSEYKNLEVNIPWRVIEQLLVLLEEETGYRRPDLSAYINSYYNSNSIFVFFYLFVHINNIINSIIIQFNHSNFMNNDITMSSFSRISIILSLASVVFSRLSNFFFVFYDKFYCKNYGRHHHYRYSDMINHEFLRELRNFYYRNNGRNSNSNRSGRFFPNESYSNGNYMNMNIDLLNNFNSSYLNNINDNYYPLPYNNDTRTGGASRTNLQQEFEDYYKNYLNSVKENKNMLLRKECSSNKENNIPELSQMKEDGGMCSNQTAGGKVDNNVGIHNCHNEKKKTSSKTMKHALWNGPISNTNNCNNNNPFSHFPGQRNISQLYETFKKRSNEKESDKKKKEHSKPYHVHKELFKDENSFRGYSSCNPNDSSSRNVDEKDKMIKHIRKRGEKNKNEEMEKEKIEMHDKYTKMVQGENESKVGARAEPITGAKNSPHSNFASCDSNMDDMYDVSDDGKEKEENSKMKKEHLMGEEHKGNVDTYNDNKGNKNVDKEKITYHMTNSPNEKISDKNMISISPNDEKPIQQKVSAQENEIKNATSSKTDNPSVMDIRRTPTVNNNNNNTPMPNINISNILNCVQNQMIGGSNASQVEPPRDKFEGMPKEVKERYKTWVENTQIFSGQMIKICRNRRPLSNAYIGDDSSKDEISFNNLLPFVWKRNMSTMNLDINLELPDDLLNAFDMHVFEFVKRNIKNNEDYKLEKFKYPTLSFCEKLFDEVEKK
ncbi:ubiquitin-like protein [Plasmodium gonderi]|uniref:Ubiquitin-like protein n=1 Tax=Plasmodium gonderi TaxID=77519 RepID=A0A1Y1JJS3_PLAGO|nr:ubiquitin-like protein [Plasmodium gonderi]GAW80284.1 ubiquitin-like protein [Plasmodium gonderi]